MTQLDIFVYIPRMATKQRITKDETVTCRIPEVLRDKIADLAEKERRTISNTTAILLEEALNARESKAA